MCDTTTNTCAQCTAANATACATGSICCNDTCAINDASNCGSCGHGCQGGTCSTQTCQPLTISFGQNYPEDLATDGTNVYWVNYGKTGSDGTVSSVSVNGPGPGTPLVSSLGFPSQIAIDANNIYWTDQGAGDVRQCQKSAQCAATMITLATNPNQPFSIASNASTVFWTNFGPNAGAGTVQSAPIGIKNSTPTTLLDNLTNPEFLAIDTSNVYVGVLNGGGYNGYIQECGIGGCGQTGFEIGFSLGGPGAIQVLGQSLYWIGATSAGDSLLSTCSLTSCGATVTNLVTENPNTLSDFIVDGTASMAYWTDQEPVSGLGNLLRCQLANCAATTTTLYTPSTDQGLGALAQDAVAVYFISGGGANGNILKLAK